MATEVERFIRVQNFEQRPGRAKPEWSTLPNCYRLRVWDMSVADAAHDEVSADENGRRFIFHIGYVDGVTRGCRVGYMGENFTVLEVSDSTRLRGLELRCAPEALPDGRAAASP